VFKKLVGLFTASLMAIFGLVAMPIAVAPAQAAPPGSAFDPGLIISDSVFFDFGSMSVADIQQFLDSRVVDCRSTDPAIDCLKSIKTEIPDSPASTSIEVGPCSAIPANPAASAAEVIYAVAVACGINPKVLITKLQKEQGLVTSTKPTSYMYRAAMGFGCPDSDPGICGQVYVGLFNQLYRAAKQLRWYGNPEGSFTYWKPGRTVSMRYNPKSSCGTKSFELKNQATANLYYYTPYTPNQAALDNLYGSGDSCSAYGNRNFWRYYHDWFGSPIGGGYLLQAAGTETFLIVNDKKFLVSDSRLLAALRPLGPIGEISSAYLESFTTSGEATQLVSDSDSGAKFLLVDGIRYSVADCQIAAQFGANCDVTIALSSLQLNTFVDGGALTRLVQTEDGNRYWIENASSRVVVDDLALQTVGGQAISATPMTIEQLVSVSPGAALASESVMFTVAGSAQMAIASGGKTYLLNSSLLTSTGLAKWFDQAPSAIDFQAIESTLVPDQIRGFVASESGQAFVITSAGKLPVTDPENWTDQIVTVSEAFLAKMPTVNAALAAPAVVTSAGNKFSYFVQSAERRISSDKNMIGMFLSLIGQPKVIELPQSAINAVEKVGEAIAPGAIVKSSSSSTLYLVDDLTNKIKLASSAQATSVSKSKTFTISSSDLAGLETRTGFTSGKVQCNGAVYLLDRGILYPTSPGAAAEFPGSVYPLSTITCAALQLSTRSVGQFIRTNSGIIYLIQDGTKKRVSSWEHLARLRGDGPGYIQATNYFSDRIPTAGTAPATVELASLEGIPAGDFGELTFVGTVPEVIQVEPEPTPESTPKPGSGSPTESVADPEVEGDAEIQYRVVSGDSLNKIAAKFSVTAAALQAYNSISNPNLISVGQLIRIPKSGTTSQPAPAPDVAEEPEPTPEPEPTATVVEYRVQSGDTLLRIASKFGISSSALQSFNSISNPNRISIGQLLKIPTSTDNTNVAQAQEPEEPEVQKTYTVVSGDTIWGISRKLGVSSSALAKLNGINNSNFIRIGQVLKVPS
jgi:LysM repeat protein